VSLRAYGILGQALTAICSLAGYARDHPHSERPPNVSGAPSKIVNP
jgi:hypothetical protein